MVPYAALFYTVYCSGIERYQGIWRDWLRNLAERCETPEPWMMCFAAKDFRDEDDFLFRYFEEKKKLGLTYDAGDFVPGFVWKLYEEQELTDEEVFPPLIKYGEQVGEEFRRLTLAGERRAYAYGCFIFGVDAEIFEEEIWNRLPEHTRALFRTFGR